MKQNSSGESSLHPTLQAALHSLDVKLEAELAQYRSHRIGANLASIAQQPSQSQINASSQVNTSSGLTAAQENLVNTPLTTNVALTNLTISPEPASFLELTHSLLNPDGYLESSEALLKNLEAETKATAKSNLLAVFLTPWRIAAVIAGFSSILGGYMILNTLRLSYLWISNSLLAQDSPAKIVARPVPTATPASITATNVPDLSSDKFENLNLSNLSRLKSIAGSPSQTSPSASISQNLPVTMTAPAQFSASSLSVAHLPTVTGKGYFYVLTDYTGQPSLEQARRVISDALVAKFPEGIRIQLGALNDRSSAQKLVQALQRQGISATIRQPK